MTTKSGSEKIREIAEKYVKEWTQYSLTGTPVRIEELRRLLEQVAADARREGFLAGQRDGMENAACGAEILGATLIADAIRSRLTPNGKDVR